MFLLLAISPKSAAHPLVLPRYGLRHGADHLAARRIPARFPEHMLGVDSTGFQGTRGYFR